MVASEPGNAFGLTRVSGGLGELSPPLSAMMTIARLGGTAVRRADRASVACLLPRHAAVSSGGVFGRRRIVWSCAVRNR